MRTRTNSRRRDENIKSLRAERDGTKLFITIAWAKPLVKENYFIFHRLRGLTKWVGSARIGFGRAMVAGFSKTQPLAKCKPTGFLQTDRDRSVGIL
jgi:hypothetical protein